MADYTEDQLDDMTDEELEAAANEARNAEPQEDETPDDENIPDNEPGNVDDESEEEFVTDTDVGDKNSEDSDDGVDDDDSKTSDNETGQPDGEPASEDDDKEEKASETPIVDFEPLKVSGKQIPINSLEELYTLASGGAAVTQKFQEIAGHKKSIAIMQEHNLTEADLSLLIEARKGSKDALASLVKLSGILFFINKASKSLSKSSFSNFGKLYNTSSESTLITYFVLTSHKAL